MSVTNPPSGASGPGSVGLGGARGTLKRSVQATFEGACLTACVSFLVILLLVSHYTLEILFNLSTAGYFLSCICVRCLAYLASPPLFRSRIRLYLLPRPRFFFPTLPFEPFPVRPALRVSVYLIPFYLSAEGLFLAVLLIRLLLTLGVASRTCLSWKKSNLRCQDCRLVWRGLGLWRGL